MQLSASGCGTTTLAELKLGESRTISHGPWQFFLTLVKAYGVKGLPQIHRYERGTSQPTLDALKRIALALNVSIDELVFEEGERQPQDDLLLLFEGVNRLDKKEQQLIKELIESVMLKHDAKRYFNRAS